MADAPLRLVIVTPERTLLDEPVVSLRFPLYDGDIGVLPGRLPLIGRLGTGELKAQMGGEERTFFIDAGFVQVRQGVVTLLTRQAVPTGQLSAAAAEQDLAEARELPALTDDEYRVKLAALNRARRMLALTRR
jgi:F-type H+-transporting ATPase subunit epsilon